LLQRGSKEQGRRAGSLGFGAGNCGKKDGVGRHGVPIIGARTASSPAWEVESSYTASKMAECKFKKKGDHWVETKGGGMALTFSGHKIKTEKGTELMLKTG